MIAPLRRRHRVMTVLLAVAVPAVLVAALGSRRAVPASRLPATLAAGPTTSTATVRSHDGSVEIALPATVAPGLLAYWTSQDVSGRLPDDAVLLGPVGGSRLRTFPLPHDADSGRIVIYSLGHQEVVEILPLDGGAP